MVLAVRLLAEKLDRACHEVVGAVLRAEVVRLVAVTSVHSGCHRDLHAADRISGPAEHRLHPFSPVVAPSGSCPAVEVLRASCERSLKMPRMRARSALMPAVQPANAAWAPPSGPVNAGITASLSALGTVASRHRAPAWVRDQAPLRGCQTALGASPVVGNCEAMGHDSRRVGAEVIPILRGAGPRDWCRRLAAGHGVDGAGRRELRRRSRSSPFRTATRPRVPRCPSEHDREVTRELLGTGRAGTPDGHTIRLVAFGASRHSQGRRDATTVPMRHVVRYLQGLSPGTLDGCHVMRRFEIRPSARLPC